MLAADNWCVKVKEKVYGPYSSQQLRKFAHEGRLAGWSMIAPAGSREWREARNEKTFSAFFGAKSARAEPDPMAFGRRDDPPATATPAPAVRNEAPAGSLVDGAFACESRPQAPSGPSALFRRPAPQGQPVYANFIVIFDVISAAASRIEPAVLSLGPAFRIAENVWTVNCGLTAIGVRNAISPHLRANEQIFVVDATNGRSSWQNFCPEVHAKIAAAYTLAKI